MVVAARGSPLSRIQAAMAKDQLGRVFPGIRFRDRWVVTAGDRDRSTSMTDLPTPGFFEKEVDRAVLEGTADVAVHSLKDIPAEISEGLEIVAALPRGPAADVLVAASSVPPPWGSLPEGFRIGTSSVRRRAIVRFHSPRALCAPIRGNVGTRVTKLRAGQYDALLLAEAGLRRLGVDLPARRLPLAVAPPAPGQGIVALVALRERYGEFGPLRERAAAAWWELRAERAFVTAIGGGCSQAIGGHASSARRSFTAAQWEEDGSARRRLRISGSVPDPEAMGKKAAKGLMSGKWERRP